MARGAPEQETPVNPYSLLEAVNSSSDTAHTGWLIFIAIMTYLVIAVAGVTHEALLLETPVQLPILQVKIQLKQFFQFAPVVLVLFHVGILAQLVLLARKTLEFDHAIRLLETSDKRTHPLRLELHNFFFVQSIAGPQRSVIMSGFLHIMSWLTIAILPVILLLYMQVAFLPYHDVTTTWINRVALLFDIVLLLLIGVFLMRAETSFFQAFWRSTAAHPLSSFATTVVLALVAYLSFFAATVPGETLDRMSRTMLGWAQVDEGGSVQQSGFVLPFLTQRADGTLFGVFGRNLLVTDSDLIVDSRRRGGEKAGEKTVKLRGRDLRYAKLDRTDLQGADLTGAQLDGASLVGANLQNAWLNCAEIDRLLLSEDRVGARCASARNVDFSRAHLGNAHMSGIDLRGAKLDEAQLEGVELANAALAGASFSSARLEKAELTGGVQAQGANFLNASLQGADLTGAQLQAADFSSASLQGAVLNFAHLQGAVLRDADLEAASLQRVKLQGADMTGMKMAGADLRGATIWMTLPPQWDSSGLADLSDFMVRPMDEAEQAALKGAIERIGEEDVRARAGEAVGPLTDAGSNWTGSPAQQTWQSWAGASPPPTTTTYKYDLTSYLTKLMCSARWSNGSIATGIARRAIAEQFRGDVVAIYDGLKSNSCPASNRTPAKVMRDLSSAAELARVQ
jgi:uncharacterized protein YjbI with pentapeptide repeats